MGGRMALGDLEFRLDDQNVAEGKLRRTAHGLCSSFCTPTSHPRPRCIFGTEKRAGEEAA